MKQLIPSFALVLCMEMFCRLYLASSSSAQMSFPPSLPTLPRLALLHQSLYSHLVYFLHSSSHSFKLSILYCLTLQQYNADFTKCMTFILSLIHSYCNASNKRCLNIFSVDEYIFYLVDKLFLIHSPVDNY